MKVLSLHNPSYKSGFLQLFSACAIWAAFVFPSFAAPLDSWHWRNPAPFANDLQSVCYGAGKFVAVASGGSIPGGVIYTSPDGSVWDDGQRPVKERLNNVAFINGIFFVLGDHGLILTSGDGLAWSQRPTGSIANLYDLKFGNGIYVVVGNGYAVFSSDGLNWTTKDLGIGPDVVGRITFGNGRFIIPQSGSPYLLHVLVSTDGNSWASSDIPLPQGARLGGFGEVEFGNGYFVAAASFWVHPPLYQDCVLDFFTSTTGSNWVLSAEAGSSRVWGNRPS